MTGLLLVLALTSAPQGFDRDAFHADIVWVTASGAADLASTEFMFRNCGSCYEVNPFMRHGAGWKKAAGAAVVLAALRFIRGKGYNRLANVLRWTVVALWSAVSVHNVYLGYR